MRKWEDVVIRSQQTIREALLQIDETWARMVLVVDDNRHLLGTLSDGDIRRGLLKGFVLSDPVDKCMWREPYTARLSDGRDAVLAEMRRKKIHQMPILDEEDRVVGLEFLDDYILPEARENWVVLMAGGLGTRLGELTKTTPKPMLQVGDKPLLETILLNFLDQGFKNFFFAVNYKSEVIENHFGDGEVFGANIQYLREAKRMGTAGSLSLLPEIPLEPLIVANGDLLTNIDYAHMLDFHVDSRSVATMGVSEYEYQIPFGVVREENSVIKGIDEKPTQKLLISAGVNVLSPKALSCVPQDAFLDMPDLFEKMIANGMCASTYQVHGYWLDIGRMPDYQKANEDIRVAFNN